MVINIDSVLETTLKDLAQKQGVKPEDLVLDALRERFLASAKRIQPRDDWERRLLEAASDCGTSLTHEALSSEGLYE